MAEEAECVCSLCNCNFDDEDNMALGCSFCQKWCHLKCVNEVSAEDQKITPEFFVILQNRTDIHWICDSPQCQAKVKSASQGDVYFDVDEVIEKEKVQIFMGFMNPLSNFYLFRLKAEGVPCIPDGQLFRSVEHALAFAASCRFGRPDLATQVKTEEKGAGAYKILHKLPRSEELEDFKVSTVEQLLQLKLRQCKKFREALRNSEGFHLAHSTHVRGSGPKSQFDTGLECTDKNAHAIEAVKKAENEGRNKLGLMLMKLRDNLAAEADFEQVGDNQELPPVAPPAAQSAPRPSRFSQNSNNLNRRPESNPARNRYMNNNRSGSGVCFFCGEPGHAARNCGHGRPVKCRLCKGMNHKAKNCHSHGREPQFDRASHVRVAQPRPPPAPHCDSQEGQRNIEGNHQRNHPRQPHVSTAVRSDTAAPESRPPVPLLPMQQGAYYFNPLGFGAPPMSYAQMAANQSNERTNNFRNGNNVGTSENVMPGNFMPRCGAGVPIFSYGQPPMALQPC